MRKLLIALLLLIASSASAAQDNRITILKAASIPFARSSYEMTLLCIGGYKFVITKPTEYKIHAILVQVFDSVGKGVKCE